MCVSSINSAIHDAIHRMNTSPSLPINILFLNMTKAHLNRLFTYHSQYIYIHKRSHVHTRINTQRHTFLGWLHRILTITRNLGAYFYFYCFIIAKLHKSDLLTVIVGSDVSHQFVLIIKKMSRYVSVHTFFAVYVCWCLHSFRPCINSFQLTWI